jgi:hypothetical protein
MYNPGPATLTQVAGLFFCYDLAARLERDLERDLGAESGKKLDPPPYIHTSIQLEN